MTNASHIIRRWAPVLTLLLLLVACGGGGDGGGAEGGGASKSSAVIGPAGGTLLGPNGAKVVIPPGALSADTLIGIEQTSVGAPALPAGFAAFGQMFAFTPHGTRFAVPVTMTLPFEPTSVPAGTRPAFYKTNAQNQWEQVANAAFGADSVRANVTSFSDATVVIPPLVTGQVGREWSFSESRAQRGFQETVEVDGAVVLGGDLSLVHEFGDAFFDSEHALLDGRTLLPDFVANGIIGSSEDGTKFYVGAEAPLGNANVPNTPIGSEARLVQVQSFIKREAGATLTFTIPRASVEAHDLNAIINRKCPEVEGPGCPLIRGLLHFDFQAINTDFPEVQTFYEVSGSAEMHGFAESWGMSAWTAAESHIPVWAPDDFDLVITDDIPGASESHVTMTLISPRTHSVDLTSIAVGEAFHVRMTASAYTHNRIAGPPSEFETSVGAYLKLDPLSIGRKMLEFTGLEPIDTPVPLVEPSVLVVPPVACVPGPGSNPAAGVLQFSAASFALSESSPTPTITVTRTGGSSGAVSVTFTTSDRTALAGTDYTPVNTTVFFADGDTAPRVVEVPIIPDPVVEPDETVDLTLSQPGGCAALGAQTTAVLTILNDDETPPSSFTIGGTVSGLVGTGLVLEDLHFLPITPGNGPFTFQASTLSGSPYEVRILTQPSNPRQICTVTNGSGTVANANITNVLVNCITPAANGALDPTFGDAGKVTTGLAGGATSIALQNDGKMLLLGKRTLARYNTSGSVDTSFGTGGQIPIVFNGGIQDAAQGLAIQTDGKIVVVGYTRVGTNDDFAVARYDDTSGALDTTFGTGGKVSLDFNGLVDRAWAVLIQPNGSIVVAGHASISTLGQGDNDFAVARFSSSGTLDPSFGTGGKVTTNVKDRTDLAFAAALQQDGKIVLTGGVGLVRYTAAGALDPTFGTGGITRLDSIGSTIVVADDLAIQSDGKIVVAGHAGVGTDIGFALARFTASGAPDNAFGTDGVVTTTFTTQDDYGRGVAVQGDGKIVVIGQSSNLLKPDFAVVRFTSAGTPDPSFGTGGKLTVDFFGAGDDAQDLAIQADGKIVVCGAATNGTSVGLGLVRINP